MEQNKAREAEKDGGGSVGFDFLQEYDTTQLVPGPEAKSSSLEITSPSFTISYQY